MTKKIMTLTEAQKARFPEFVDKWIKIGLSTEPANRKKSEKAIRNLYALANLKEPKVIWLPCPLSAAMSAVAYTYIRNGKTKAVGSAVRSAVGSAVRSAVRSAVGSAVYAYFGGPLWSGYSGWADYFNEVLSISIDRNYLDLVENCGYFWPLDDICFMSERPTHINRDEQGRLHSENSQSIGYKSGFGLWHWHGVKIPSAWILDKKSLSSEIALQWVNVEERRAACEIIGWANVLEHPSLNPKILDKDQTHIGMLIQVDLPDAPAQWFLKYQCGTGRWFAESVNDKAFDTALKANAGGNGYRPGNSDEPESYIPFLRT